MFLSLSRHSPVGVTISESWSFELNVSHWLVRFFWLMLVDISIWIILNIEIHFILIHIFQYIREHSIVHTLFVSEFIYSLSTDRPFTFTPISRNCVYMHVCVPCTMYIVYVLWICHHLHSWSLSWLIDGALFGTTYIKITKMHLCIWCGMFWLWKSIGNCHSYRKSLFSFHPFQMCVWVCVCMNFLWFFSIFFFSLKFRFRDNWHWKPHAITKSEFLH